MTDNLTLLQLIEKTNQKFKESPDGLQMQADFLMVLVIAILSEMNPESLSRIKSGITQSVLGFHKRPPSRSS